MNNQKNLEKEIIQLTTLGTLVKAYGELASIRMKKTRDSVLYTRTFLAEVDKVFTEVRASYEDQLKHLARRREHQRNGQITLLAHNGKTVAVFLSANSRLYGDIVARTFETFCDDVANRGSEATILGKAGLSMFRERYPGKPYTYFEFSDTAINQQDLVSVIHHLVQYEAIHVFFGKYDNLVVQNPTQFVLSSQTGGRGERQEKVSYLFEPTLEEILRYFEREIFSALFEQTLRESQLSKFASRLMAMDRAYEQIKEKLNATKVSELQLKHRLQNQKQLNMLVPIYSRYSHGR